ncbi:MAG: cytochrome c [Gaiellaceae bacterium]
MRRPAVLLLAVLTVGLGACGGEEDTRPVPDEVEGTTPTATVPKTAPTASGDAAAGKSVFTKQGCGACHAFKPAGTSGQTGPALDNLAADAEKAGDASVEEYTRVSIEDPNAYTVPGFGPGIMPAYDSLSDKQLNDLVTFLTQGK